MGMVGARLVGEFVITVIALAKSFVKR